MASLINRQTIVRKGRKTDILALAELFENSVRQIAPEKYSPQQVSAWAASALDRESFSRFVLEVTTFVAETNNFILGFGGIDRTGHVISLYVLGDYNRQGIGSRLLERIIEYGCQNNCDRVASRRHRLYTKASEFSKPLFEKFGFETHEEENVERNGKNFYREKYNKFVKRSP